MPDKADLSLDDIIKLNKKQQQKSRNNTNSKRQQTSAKAPRLRKLASRSGITRSNPSHQQAAPKKEITSLHVSNLHFGVSNQDIKELFSTCGPVRKAAVHYDQSGRSLGTAEVIFTTREAAVQAIKKFNNIPLDGRDMSIKMVSSQVSVRSPTKSRIGVKPGSGVHKNSQVRGSTRGAQVNNKGKSNKVHQQGGKTNFKPQQRGQRQPKPQLTAEQLDADLETYTGEMNVDG